MNDAMLELEGGMRHEKTLKKKFFKPYRLFGSCCIYTMYVKSFVVIPYTESENEINFQKEFICLNFWR